MLTPRGYIIKQMHNRIMNKDSTANLDYPQWKRRVLIVFGFIALRFENVFEWLLLPILWLLIFGYGFFEAIRECYEGFSDMVGETRCNLVRDIIGCKNAWSGVYGLGKLIERGED